MTHFRIVRAQVSEAELTAIDAIRKAYLACNLTDSENSRSPLVYEVTPGTPHVLDGTAEATAMGFLAEAGRTAWRQVGIPVNYDLWNEMIDNGEDAAYNYRLYLEGQLDR